MMPNAQNRQDMKPPMQLGVRKKIGLVETEPKNAEQTPEGLTKHQQSLRESAIKRFKSKKIEKFVSKQIEHFKSTQEVAEVITFFFDENGKPPSNLSLEDIIAERNNLKAQIHWIHAIRSEMQNKLALLKKREALALALILDKTSIPLENRQETGLIDHEPTSLNQTSKEPTKLQKLLREATVNRFKANRVKAYISDQVDFINFNRQIADSTRILFDDNWVPPINAPIEDIITKRTIIDGQIRWLEALSSELHQNLSKVQEIEDFFLELISKVKD
ncbi:MAG: hypothetical protein NTX06_13485 [Proteobacteria bacterium]|nr:hypothetical protein [Pseudomonadota bacterium]